MSEGLAKAVQGRSLELGYIMCSYVKFELFVKWPCSEFKIVHISTFLQSLFI